jgi:hypothetical protein
MKTPIIATLVSGLILFSSVSHAIPIVTSASATDDNGGTYSYLFQIDQDTGDSTIFHATLTNTSDAPGNMIDLLAFNMADPDPALNTDYFITNVSPTWSFIQVANSGIQFDYLGERSTPGSRLDAGESLFFTIDFIDSYAFPTDPYDLWTTAEEACGRGIGGGGDCGQVAVSFQEVAIPEGSDLLASNWGPGTSVPEPGTLVLLGAGLIGIGFQSRRRIYRTINNNQY